MPDTGERREISRFVNAKEAETVKDAAKLAAKTEQRSAKSVQESRARKRRKVLPGSVEKPDQEASGKMVDEGDPNPLP